jgi:hypothetical protein
MASRTRCCGVHAASSSCSLRSSSASCSATCRRCSMTFGRSHPSYLLPILASLRSVNIPNSRPIRLRHNRLFVMSPFVDSRRRREREPLMKLRTSRDAKLVHGRTAGRLCFSFMSTMSQAIFSNFLITLLSSGERLSRSGKYFSTTIMASAICPSCRP